MIFFLVFLFVCVSANDYYVEIYDDGPVVVGANITFSAQLFIVGGGIPKGNFKYKWKDNSNPQHQQEFTSDHTSNWTVSYPPHVFEAGIYQVQVEVFTPIVLIDWPECFQRKKFELTSMLNGELVLLQDNTTVTSNYISNATEVIQDVKLNHPDFEFVKNNASFIETYWYLDCDFIAKTNDLKLPYNYTTSDTYHNIDVLLIVSHNVVHNSTNSSNPVVDTESSTDIYLINNNTKINDLKSNTVGDTSNNTKFSYLTMKNGSDDSLVSPHFDFDCINKKVKNFDATDSYGLFSREIKVKAPVANVRAEGNNWLQHGEMLNLQVWCNGSAPITYCIQYWNGNHTVTGNESCISKKIVLSTCDFQVTHYFGNSTNYTVVIILENDVQKVVRGVNVIVYEAITHAQLSVIIVPVTAGLVAVILIVFGIAYFFQTRNRYIVEVADFDFSNASDMEYKTFSERLVDAVSNAFNKTEDYSEQDSNSGAPTNRKYGSMQ